ncbi:hypothetical protein F6V25_07555 [Oryzomonas japonica]|uniref:Uncharacterized protein n=1 Tax=Oryzomonas japonica TaxID=2603858 RepID=A0A7J4ZQY7_9BACT|nr:hypothetical protein [Oryzomonas japonica]KAB0665571.1 hypothetical protein F6V25_07555 [Oryzomonas japonica]
MLNILLERYRALGGLYLRLELLILCLKLIALGRDVEAEPPNETHYRGDPRRLGHNLPVLPQPGGYCGG